MALVSHRFVRYGRQLPPELEEARVSIVELAKSYGLDFFDTIFEMCSYEEINMIASYGGFPTRYPHWRFGMEFLQMQKSYEFGLSKIYEMVINTDPSYAYLMDCNLIVDQKLVMAHVLGHVDFFKNNLWFAHTNRRMLDEVANHATKVRQIMNRHGATEVEQFIDLCLSIDNLTDPYSDHITRDRSVSEQELEAAELDPGVGRIKSRSYMDKHINPPEFLKAQREKRLAELNKMRSFPESPQRDVMQFLVKHAPRRNWQREILSIIREEAVYFAPQGLTKIMNEGWATYWHTKLMTRHILTDAEVIDFCDHNAGTLQTAPGQLNPYKLGVELWRHIEERWDKGRFGKEWMECKDPAVRASWDRETMQGREKIFQVRKTHNDITFVDTFLTEDFCREQGFFATHYDKRREEWIIDSREFLEVKSNLLSMLASRGTPRISVVDANHSNRGELLLLHEHEGFDIQLDWAQTVLQNISLLWGRPVVLETVVDQKSLRLFHDGTELTREEIKEQEDSRDEPEDTPV